MIQPGRIYNIDGENLYLIQVSQDIDGNIEYLFTAARQITYDEYNITPTDQITYKAYNVSPTYLLDNVYEKINPVETEKVNEKIDSNDWNALLGE